MELTKNQRSALDLDRSLCVTAGAGAGKTRVLVERYLKLLESGVKVSQILALTFTEKAAAEMKEKVRKALSEKEGAEWKERLDELNWCSISTFHSFCANLIRQYPLVSGIAPRFQVLDDVNLSLLKAEAFDSLLCGEVGVETNSSLVRALTWYGSLKTRERLEHIYERRAEMAEWLESHRSIDSLQTWAEEMDKRMLHQTVDGLLSDEEFRSSLKALADLAGTHSGSIDGGQRYLAAAGPIICGLLEGGPDDEMLEMLYSLDQVKGRRDMGSAKCFSNDAKCLLTGSYDVIRTALDEACLDSVSFGDESTIKRTVDSTYDLIRIYDAYSAAMDAAKRKANSIDFSDMIATAMMLVARNDVVGSLRRRYANLLVDEFQDTDPIQSKIVWAVAGDDPGDRLFIVGDPKQSIYGFRNADVAMFHEAKKRLVDKDEGAAVHLDVNFRSSPQVVDLVNHVFSRLMVAVDRDFKFKYEEMCLSEERSPDVGSVELVLPGPGPSEEGLEPAVSSSEPELVASRIMDIVEKGEKLIYTDEAGNRLAGGRRPRYGDITILLRARTHLKMFEKSLRDRNIPYQVHKGLGFFERQEVMDVYNILRFLADRSDDVSLYGVLRSPYFAFSDEELFNICRGPGYDLWPRLKNRAEQNDQRSADAVRTLGSWISRAGRMPISELLQYVQVTSGISAVYAAQTNSAQLLANLDKLGSMLRNASADGICTPHHALEWMENAMALAKLEGEAPMDASAMNAVNIMTVHASKGLEFPIVVVPELGQTQKGFGSSILFDEKVGLGMTVLGADYKLAKNAALSLIENVEVEKDAEESKRLLYVAMTRARDHLVLSGLVRTSEGRKMNWMDLLLSAIAPQGFAPDASSITVNERVKIGFVRDTDMKAGSAAREETVPLSLPEGLDGTARWKAMPRPKRRMDLTVTGLESFESWEDRFIRKDVFGVPEGWLEPDAGATAKLFGTAAHEVLQGRDPEAVAMKYGLSPESVSELARIRNRFLASRSGAKSASYRELAFITEIDGQRLRGTVDLLERSASNMWNVVDFKTDAVKEGSEEKDARKHADQLRAYSLMLGKALNVKVGGQVYFIGTDRFVTIGEEAGFEQGLKERIKACSDRVLKIKEAG